MLEIRPVALDTIEWNEILNIRNLTSHGFGNTDQIDSETHFYFMKDNYHDYVVAEMKGEIVVFGVVVKDDISVAVKADYQGLGIGKNIISVLSVKFPEAFAKVKIDNEASLKLFESCGFKKTWYILEK
jgi:ribosomal protein S18 acetylase RimI-like enzyme